jgi:hypothetical protein
MAADAATMRAIAVRPEDEKTIKAHVEIAGASAGGTA